MFSFTVPGRPVPAVRMTRNGTWKPQAVRYLQYKTAVGWAAKAAIPKPMECRVAVDIVVYLAGGVMGDWDNYAKSLCDGMNSIAYLDDRQIVEGRLRKVTGVQKHEQRAEVTLREVD